MLTIVHYYTIIALHIEVNAEYIYRDQTAYQIANARMLFL